MKKILTSIAVLLAICAVNAPNAFAQEVEWVTASVLQTGRDDIGVTFELTFVDSNGQLIQGWYRAKPVAGSQMLAITVWAYTHGQLVRVKLDPTGQDDVVHTLLLSQEANTDDGS